METVDLFASLGGSQSGKHSVVSHSVVSHMVTPAVSAMQGTPPTTGSGSEEKKRLLHTTAGRSSDSIRLAQGDVEGRVGIEPIPPEERALAIHMEHAFTAEIIPTKRRVKRHRTPENEQALYAGLLDSKIMARIARDYTGNGRELIIHALRVLRDDLWLERWDARKGVRWCERLRVPIAEQQKARDWLQIVMYGKPTEHVEHAVNVNTQQTPAIDLGKLTYEQIEQLEAIYRTAGLAPGSAPSAVPGLVHGGSTIDGTVTRVEPATTTEGQAEAPTVHPPDVP